MLMYHKDSKQPVEVHRSKVESMENRGWTTKPISKSPKPPPTEKEE